MKSCIWSAQYSGDSRELLVIAPFSEEEEILDVAVAGIPREFLAEVVASNSGGRDRGEALDAAGHAVYPEAAPEFTVMRKGLFEVGSPQSCFDLQAEVKKARLDADGLR